MPELSNETWVIVSLGVLAVASQAWEHRKVLLGWWNKRSPQDAEGDSRHQDLTAHECLDALRLLRVKAIEDGKLGLVEHVDALAGLLLSDGVDYDPDDVRLNR